MSTLPISASVRFISSTQSEGTRRPSNRSISRRAPPAPVLTTSASVEDSPPPPPPPRRIGRSLVREMEARTPFLLEPQSPLPFVTNCPSPRAVFSPSNSSGSSPLTILDVLSARPASTTSQSAVDRTTSAASQIASNNLQKS